MQIETVHLGKFKSVDKSSEFHNIFLFAGFSRHERINIFFDRQKSQKVQRRGSLHSAERYFCYLLKKDKY